MSKIFSKNKNIEREEKASSGSLNLKPIIEDTPASSVTPPPHDRFPNFIHQGSHLAAAAAHDVDRPSPLILPIAVAAAVIWIICVMAMYFGFFGNITENGTRLNAAQWITVLMLAFVPALLIGVIAYTLQKLSAMSSAATRLTLAARSFSNPDDAMIARAKGMSDAVENEIKRIDASFEMTVGRVKELETLMQTERQKLDATSETVKGRFDMIGATLLDQHKALDGLADIFDQRMANLAKLLDEHGQALESNTQLADQKLQEARVSLQSAIADLAEASDTVRGAAAEATSSLTVGHQDFESLGNELQRRTQALTESYKKKTEELSELISGLREEQDSLTASMEDRLALMRDLSLSAQAGSENLNAASEAGRKTVEALADAANLTGKAVKQRFAEMEEMVRYSNARAESISEKASRRLQDSLAHTRKEIARIEADMLALQDKLQQPESFSPELQSTRSDAIRPREKKPLTLMPLDEDTSSDGPPDNIAEIHTDFTAPMDYSSDDSDFDLVIEPPSEPLDLQSPDPHAEITTFDADTLRPAAGQEIGRRKTRRRGRWGWRDILTGIDSEDEADANNTPETKNNSLLSVSDEMMVRSLSELGLTPAAIVDDGCIIEACNARKSSGDLAVSQIVAKRLGDPVRYLYRKMEENPALKSQARAYTTQYKIGIEAIDNDREAIRIRLESDAGRAFLLCDAALNG